jgi:methylphosphotriester-DNA--protein-cysteine methyltransferase
MSKKYFLLSSDNKTFESLEKGTLGGNKKLKIYGKLDCKSALRYIEKGFYINNRVFFKNEKEARKSGYRPCGICMKKEYLEWKNKLIKVEKYEQ